MAKQTFTVGQVLTAAQVTALQTNEYNQTVSVKTASYTLVAADVGTRIEMNSGSATTVTVNTALFAAGDTLVIQNKGAGVSTVTAGTATVSTSGSLALAQYDQGTLYFVSTGVAIFFNATAGSVGATSGLNLISTTALSGSTSYSINSCFSATYKNYKIILTVDPGQQTFLRLRVAGADNTSSNYKYAGYYQQVLTSSALVPEYSNGTATSWRVAYQDLTGSSTTIDMFAPFATEGTSYLAHWVQNKATTDGYVGVYQGATTVTTSYTGFTLFVGSGTFTGSVSVYGYGV